MHIFIVGPAAHRLSGTSAAVATAGACRSRGKTAGTRGLEKRLRMLDWVEGGWREEETKRGLEDVKKEKG